MQPGDSALTVHAPMHGLLTAERTLLNLVCHLSGIATATAAWVDAVDGTKAKIRDTRKTLPGLRSLQKYAVRVGGGVNHRLGLGDAALIKDNHVVAAGSVVAALRAVRAAAPDLPCEVEVDSLEQLDEILSENPELVLLDNFPVWQTQIAVQRRDTRAPAPSSSHPAAFRWTPRPTSPGPVSTTSPSGRSPTRCGCSTSVWTSEMRQLTFEEAGRYGWRDVPDPEITQARQALVRPLQVACCDLDVAVARGAAPLPPGYAVGHEGLAEVVAVGAEVVGVNVGDRVVVPFQISCGACRECRRGVTSSCGSVPLMAMYGLGPLAGLDGGGFMSDLVLVPYADAMLIPLPATVDPIAVASLSDNIPDGWRAVGPFAAELADLDPADRRVLVIGRLSIGLYAAALGRRCWLPRRLRRHRPGPSGRRGEDSARSSTTSPSRTSRGSRIPSRFTPPATRRCCPRRCARPGRTACAPTPGSIFRRASRCRCCRPTRGVSASRLAG